MLWNQNTSTNTQTNQKHKQASTWQLTEACFIKATRPPGVSVTQSSFCPSCASKGHCGRTGTPTYQCTTSFGQQGLTHCHLRRKSLTASACFYPPCLLVLISLLDRLCSLFMFALLLLLVCLLLIVLHWLNLHFFWEAWHPHFQTQHSNLSGLVLETWKLWCCNFVWWGSKWIMLTRATYIAMSGKCFGHENMRP